MAYEHKIIFYPVKYRVETKGEYIEREALPTEPEPFFLTENPLYVEDIKQLGLENWELVTVTPLLRGCYNEPAGYGYSLTAGYYFIWRRKI